MFNNLSSPQSYLSTRRSGRPREMVAPGPDTKQLDTILEMALRTPDHGKLAPWRFVKIGEHQRDALASVLADAFHIANPDCRDSQVGAATACIYMAPSLTIMIYCPKESTKIPKHEQILSAGAAGMNLLHAAHINGFVASWITGWAAYDDHVRKAFCTGEEEIIGFFYMGTPSQPLTERTRPDPKLHISQWQG